MSSFSTWVAPPIEATLQCTSAWQLYRRRRGVQKRLCSSTCQDDEHRGKLDARRQGKGRGVFTCEVAKRTEGGRCKRKHSLVDRRNKRHDSRQIAWLELF